MKKKKTIFRRLFLSFFALTAVTLAASIGVFYSYTAKLVRSDAADSLSQTAHSLNEQLDSMLDSMDQMSLQLVSTQTVAGEFAELCEAAAENDGGRVLAQSGQISKTLYSTLGGWTTQQRQLNLLSADGDFIGTASMAVYQKTDASQYAWLEKALHNGGARFICRLDAPVLSKKQQPVIALIRQLRIGIGAVDAVLEIEQDYAYLEQLVREYCPSEDNRVFLFSGEGELLYPQEFPPEEAAALFSQLSNGDSRIELHNERYIAVSENGNLCRWQLAVLRSEKSYAKPLLSLRLWAIMLALALFAAALLMSVTVAKKISDPIRRMHRRLSDLPLTGQQMEQTPELNELEELNAAFERACERLKGATDELVAARAYELQAWMLALEAQMNPHFIYNTIALLHAVADENEDEAVVTMCEDFSRMLRYSMHPQQGPVTLEQELSYTKSYLALMKRRYEDDFRYEIVCPPEANGCRLPKLCIQPLVENCFKHGGSQPPWLLRITVSLTQNAWRVTVEDNGRGFADVSSLRKMLSQAAEQMPTAVGAQTEGIGLLNIFLRLRLLYREQGGMTLLDSELGGARVEIFGGRECADDAELSDIGRGG